MRTWHLVERTPDGGWTPTVFGADNWFASEEEARQMAAELGALGDEWACGVWGIEVHDHETGEATVVERLPGRPIGIAQAAVEWRGIGRVECLETVRLHGKGGLARRGRRLHLRRVLRTGAS